MNRITVLFGLLFLPLCVACGAPQGPHVRFAHASGAEIEAAQGSGQVVWYDFEAGDDVPFGLGLLGIAEAVTEEPVRMVARRDFSIVMFPDGRTMFSFDGRSLVSSQSVARWSIALGAHEGQARGVIVLVLGRRQDLPEELR